MFHKCALLEIVLKENWGDSVIFNPKEWVHYWSTCEKISILSRDAPGVL